MANFYKKSQIPNGGEQQEKSRQSARRAWQKKAQAGRSMVEMLGVLAIIGMLSIGSISAYSRAMFKHQLNQFTDAYNLLLNNTVQIYDAATRQNPTNVDLNQYIANTSMLPAGMYYDKSTKYIYDVFKNRHLIYYRVYKTGMQYYISTELGAKEKQNTEKIRAICRNMALAAKENAGEISAISIVNYGTSSGGDSSNFLPVICHHQKQTDFEM